MRYRFVHVTRSAAMALVIVLASVCFGARAQAQSLSVDAREQARALGTQALELYDRGDCHGALERFDEAARLVRAPTLELYAARCLVKLGRLVEAEARYASIATIPLDAGAPESFRTARTSAEAEGKELARRVPRVSIQVDAPAASVLVDGKVVEPSKRREWIRLDPGPHRIEARQGGQAALEEVALTEGQSKAVVLRLMQRTPPGGEAAAVHTDDAPSGSYRRTLGWVGVGLGVGGLGVGILSGVLAAGTRSDLSHQGCHDECPPRFADEVERYDRERAISSVGFIAGTTLVVVGTLLLLTAPTAKSSARSSAGQGTIRF